MECGPASKRRKIDHTLDASLPHPTNTTSRQFCNYDTNTLVGSYTNVAPTQASCGSQNEQTTFLEHATLEYQVIPCITTESSTYEGTTKVPTESWKSGLHTLPKVKIWNYNSTTEDKTHASRNTFHQTKHVSETSGTDKVVLNEPQISGEGLREAELGEETVCYGMLDRLQAQNARLNLGVSDRMPAQWNGQMQLQDAFDGSNIIDLQPRTFQLLTTLVEHVGAFFQFWIWQEQQKTDDGDSAKRPNFKHNSDVKQFLSVIIYGPLDMATVVGDWMNTAQLFLQMPVECVVDVKYKNPHCLSFYDVLSLTTQELNSTMVNPDDTGDKATKCDDFTGLYTDETYNEAGQPSRIQSQLHSHQKVALGFLLEREKGWDFDGPRAGIWKRKSDSFGMLKYTNTLSGRVQTSPPNDFRGGILADEMGLGKTCTILSLIAMDRVDKQTVESKFGGIGVPTRGTLIVVPFALLQVWEKQIREHFKPNTVKWIVLHGSSRRSSIRDLESYDIVITTYNTVTIEWRNSKCSRSSAEPSLLFSDCWHRIVLDEAHVIRNKGTANSRAVCALRSDRRWCVTGTPIQNRLSDLFGLLRFLGIEPYNRFKEFEEDILRPWKSHNDKVALMRLLHLLKSIAIRRPRSVIILPPKEEIIVPVLFTTRERATYESAREGAIEALDAAFAEPNNRTFTYINALQRINDLRYICNHGTKPVRDRHRSAFRVSRLDPKSDTPMGEFDMLMDTNSYNCTQCGTDIQEELEEDSSSLQLSRSSFAQTLELGASQLCKLCFQQVSTQNSPAASSPSPSNPEDDASSPTASAIFTSSKIQALIFQIQQLPPNEKSVIFSYWTSTLAAVTKALTDSRINYIQYDGTLSRTQRTATLHNFATNPSTAVILISITCGGQGLDLTAANNAFLLEPQWNPMLEEQAMSRVHRLGQTQSARLVRFIVQGTWEEKIRVLQERKRNLVDLIIERRNLKDGDEGRKELQFLRELIA